MKNIKKGSFKDCLVDFFRRFGRVEALWVFAAVGSKTETRWRVRGFTPTGEIYLRVLFFLDLLGYEIEELKDTPQEVVIAARCIAFGITDLQTLSTEINLPQSWTFFKYVRGEMLPSGERAAILARFVARNTAPLLEVMRLKRRELKSLIISDDVVKPAKADTSLEDPSADKLITQFASACLRIREIGSKFLSGPEGTRIKLRKQMNKNGEPELHQTWDVLHQLMKERREE